MSWVLRIFCTQLAICFVKQFTCDCLIAGQAAQQPAAAPRAGASHHHASPAAQHAQPVSRPQPMQGRLIGLYMQYLLPREIKPWVYEVFL